MQHRGFGFSHLPMTSILDLRPAPICPDSFNLADYVMHGGQDHKVALRQPGDPLRESITFGDLRSVISNTAAALQKKRIGAGDYVMLRLGNTIEFPVVFLALAALGAIPVITSAQATQAEVDQMLAQVPVQAMVFAQNVALPDSNQCLIDVKSVITWDGTAIWNPLLGSADRPGYVMFTSGTSGVPKAVLHGHRAVWARRMMWQDWYGLTREDRMLHAGAFNWSYTLGTGLLDPWAMGATAIIAQHSHLEDLPGIIAAERATIFAASPGVFRKVLQTDFWPKTPDLRHALSAGDQLSGSLNARWENVTDTKIYPAFGMTECSTFLSASPHGAPTLSVQTGRKVGILNDKNVPVGFGVQGAIAVDKSDPGLMLGYLENGAPKLPLVGDWFVTSDQGMMEPDGRIHFAGRSRDMMNAGGYRVSPIEVESTLSNHTALDLAVCDIEIKQDVSVIVAFLVDATDQDCATLQAHAEQALARYKQPRAYVSVPHLPRSANGKLLRNELQTLWEIHHG